jgi:V/A-type H+-transporting ATPase subunit E
LLSFIRFTDRFVDIPAGCGPRFAHEVSMDIQVGELIERIKHEGVAEAERRAAAIVARAEAKAAAIVKEAEKTAARVAAEGRDKAAADERNGRASLELAGRDLVLKLREEIRKTFEAVVRRETAAAFSAETLRSALPGLIKSWREASSDDLVLLVPPDQAAGIEAFLRDKLAADLRGGLEIRPLPGLRAGFRLSEKSGSVYYDFSAEAVAGLLAQFLQPRLAEIMKHAAGAPGAPRPDKRSNRGGEK